jgi:type II secretory pathway pseudopilin PulG
MSVSKAFSLIEIIVILVILGIVTAIVIPNLVNSIEQTKAQQAKNNLLAISAAQEKYFEDYGYYCSNQAPNPSCGSNPIANLSLSAVTGDPFSYSCSNTSLPYQCNATDGTVTLTTTGSGVNCTVGGSRCPS